jgi:hypothetical protein
VLFADCVLVAVWTPAFLLHIIFLERVGIWMLNPGPCSCYAPSLLQICKFPVGIFHVSLCFIQYPRKGFQSVRVNDCRWDGKSSHVKLLQINTSIRPNPTPPNGRGTICSHLREEKPQFKMKNKFANEERDRIVSLSRIQRLVWENKEMLTLANEINKFRGNYIGHHCQSHSETQTLRTARNANESGTFESNFIKYLKSHKNIKLHMGSQPISIRQYYIAQLHLMTSFFFWQFLDLNSGPLTKQVPYHLSHTSHIDTCI